MEGIRVLTEIGLKKQIPLDISPLLCYVYNQIGGKSVFLHNFIEEVNKMASKDTSQHDYNRGYSDARSGERYKTPSVLDIVAGAVVPGIDPVSTKSYDEGYRDGKSDRK